MSDLFATPPMPQAQPQGAKVDPVAEAADHVVTPEFPEYRVPPARREAAPARGISKRAIAGVAAGSLALGLLGGVGGAALWDSYGPSNVNPVTLPPAVIGTGDGTVLNPYAAVVEAALPSVVQIEVRRDGRQVSSGSGFVIESDGYLLTNNHVVEEPGARITVVFADGSQEDAEIVGATADYDLAVLKVNRSGLTPLALGDSDAVTVGDPVIAIGSPLGLGSTVTTGIISALHRPVTTSGEGAQAFINALQTDAAINPGNSGGPLLNMRGEVIGINSAVAAMPGASSLTGAGSVGLGFAIPSNQARRTAEELIEFGVASYPVVGVVLDGQYFGEGVKVADEGYSEGQTGVVPGGPADRAGIKPGDIITAFEGRPVTEANVLIVGIRAKTTGDTVTFTINRDGQVLEVSVTLTSNDQVDYGEPRPSAPEPSPSPSFGNSE